MTEDSTQDFSTQVFMHLKILLPFQVFLEKKDISRIVAETSAGSLGLLPHRLDFVAVLEPGIFVYENESEGEVYLAVDEGIMTKTGMDVLVSVRNAIRGKELGQLIELEFSENLARFCNPLVRIIRRGNT